MEIHALQTGTVRVKQFQLTGASNSVSRFYQLLFTQKWSAWLPIYCWLIKINDQLILIDTGETSKIYQPGYIPSGGLYHKAVQTRINAKEEIAFQLKALGYEASDINTIILTHLHGDHIGGIHCFPHADFYVSKKEYKLAVGKKGSKNGYFKRNWPNWFHPNLIEYENKVEGNFSKSYTLNDLSEIIIVPTPGHSIGHQSVIIKNETQTYFLGGDLTYNLDTLEKGIPNAVLPNKEAFISVKKVNNYVKTNQCVFLSSHDWKVSEILKQSSR